MNKASVTIVFDNEDESSSPVGYEQYKEVNVTRQVLIGGKSKYLINGRTSQAGVVANLFHSVQLNVNNPHFLIMQGEGFWSSRSASVIVPRRVPNPTHVFSAPPIQDALPKYST